MRLAIAAAVCAWLAIASCGSLTTCGECTSQDSWSGSSCRWCPVDNKCHAYGSLLNKCDKAQNIDDQGECKQDQATHFDPDVSKKALFFSAAAYNDDPTACFKSAAGTCKLVGTYTSHFGKVTTTTTRAYIASCDDTQTIVVAFRGTTSSPQLIAEGLMTLLQPKMEFPMGGRVEEYFMLGFEDLWPKMQADLDKVTASHPGWKILVTGHSLGGALASLASTTIAGKYPNQNVALYSFGQPRIGNYEYALTHDEHVPASWRVVHHMDIVTHLPTCAKAASICIAGGMQDGPYHHGTEVYFDESMDSFKECHGLPHNEDRTCSNAAVTWIGNLPHASEYYEDHIHYYGIEVGEWGRSGCPLSHLI